MRETFLPYFSHRDDSELPEEYHHLSSFRESVVSHFRNEHFRDISLETLQTLLKGTKVLSTKDFVQWNMDKIWDLLNGAIWSKKAFDYTLGKTKFFKRIINWLKPSRKEFSGISWSKQTFVYARVACQVCRVMCGFKEGIEDSNFRSFVDELLTALYQAIEKQESLHDLKDNVFKRLSLERTLSCVYFCIIGIFTEAPQSICLFQDHTLFNYLFGLSKMMRSKYGKYHEKGINDYLITRLLCSCDFTQSDNLRMLFTSWISQGSILVRRTLLLHLEMLFKCEVPNISKWALSIICLQVQEKNIPALHQTAIRVLERICISDEYELSDNYVDEIIDANILPEENEHFNHLNLRLIVNEKALKRIISSPWLEQQCTYWLEKGNCVWVTEQEKSVLRAINGPSESTPFETCHQLYSNTIGTEQDLQYYEQLFWLPWQIEVKLIRPSGDDVILPVDVHFDYNVCLMKDDAKPMGCIGPAIVAYLLYPQGTFALPDRAEITIKLSMGDKCLENQFSRLMRQRTAKTNERKPWSSKESVILKDGVGWIFRGSGRRSKELNCLHRVFFKIDVPKYEQSITRFLPHLFCELSKTDVGFEYITQHGHLDVLCKQIDNFEPKVSGNAHLKFRAALTAIGMIGSTERGFDYLDSAGVVEKIAKQVLSSPILSIKSTCLYVVGLFSRTPQGYERLEKLKFEFPPENVERGLCIAIPKNLKALFSFPTSDENSPFSWALDPENDFTVTSNPSMIKPDIPLSSKHVSELSDQRLDELILAHVSGLTSAVTLKSSSESLLKIKQTRPDAFEQIHLYREVFHLLNTYTVSISARRFVNTRLFNHVNFKYLRERSI